MRIEIFIIFIPFVLSLSVIGQYPHYINLAKSLNASYFSVDINYWESLPEDERWNINMEF